MRFCLIFLLWTQEVFLFALTGQIEKDRFLIETRHGIKPHETGLKVEQKAHQDFLSSIQNWQKNCQIPSVSTQELRTSLKSNGTSISSAGILQISLSVPFHKLFLKKPDDGLSLMPKLTVKRGDELIAFSFPSDKLSLPCQGFSFLWKNDVFFFVPYVSSSKAKEVKLDVTHQGSFVLPEDLHVFDDTKSSDGWKNHQWLELPVVP
jgi:hypothetical protein